MQRKLRLFRITRETRDIVWIRSINFGSMRRGLSIKFSKKEFEEKYLPLPRKDGLDERLFFRKHETND